MHWDDKKFWQQLHWPDYEIICTKYATIVSLPKWKNICNKQFSQNPSRTVKEIVSVVHYNFERCFSVVTTKIQALLWKYCYRQWGIDKNTVIFYLDRNA